MAKHKSSKTALCREFASMYSTEWNTWTAEEIAKDIGGGVTPAIVAYTRVQMKKEAGKHKKREFVNNVATASQVPVVEARNGTHRSSLTNPTETTRMSVQLSPHGDLSMIINDSDGRVLCTMGISKDGLSLKRANAKTQAGKAGWENLFKLLEAGFLS